MGLRPAFSGSQTSGNDQMRWPLAIALFCVACASATEPDPLRLDDATFDREVAHRFQYGPPAPTPSELADPRAGQIADAQYFATFPSYDRAYTSAARTQALRLAQRLRDDAGSLSHEQFVLRVAEIAALADNGHTAIGENAFRKNTPRLPLRTYLFSDGLFVLWASPANADLLGARIDTIDGRSIAAIYARIRHYEGGTEAHRERELTPMLESPALLQAAGVANEPNALRLTGVLANNQPFARRIEAEQRDRSAWVSSTARVLYPARSGGRMVSFLRQDSALPVSLRDEGHLFGAAALPQQGFYIKLETNNDADEGPIGAFLDGALAHIRSEHPAFVVLDMRLNGGGDYTKTYAFAHALPAAVGATGRIYVLTSSWTFSAAITTVAALKQAGGDRVTIVGEPVGDRLRFWAEGDAYVLPNAFVIVHYATGRHVYDGPCTDTRTCFWLNYRYPVRVRSLAPDIPVANSFAVYRQGQDSALQAVLTDVRARSVAP